MTKSIAEFEREIKALEEEREFMLAKTAIHVPGSSRGKYEQEINRIKEKIAFLKEQYESQKYIP